MQLREAITGRDAGPNKQVMALLAVAIVLLGVFAYAASPFTAAGGLRCNGALVGSTPKEKVTTGLLVGREKPLCRAKGNSRLIVAGVATLISLILGLSAVLLPTGPLEDLFLRRDE
ncbi:MAG: hypothetical protein M3N28_08630 [Actinomycetota bacterium]|nr:hypothetical protein [Actinomycetota bacterium]